MYSDFICFLCHSSRRYIHFFSCWSTLALESVAPLTVAFYCIISAMILCCLSPSFWTSHLAPNFLRCWVHWFSWLSYSLIQALKTVSATHTHWILYVVHSVYFNTLSYSFDFILWPMNSLYCTLAYIHTHLHKHIHTNIYIPLVIFLLSFFHYCAKSEYHSQHNDSPCERQFNNQSHQY